MHTNKRILNTYFTFLFFTFLLIFTFCSEPEQEIIENIPPPIKLDEFGFKVDSFKVHSGVFGKRETLAEILLPHNITFETITKIASLPPEDFDERKLVPGKKYFVYKGLDSLNTAELFIYKYDPINYVVVNLSDSIYSYKKKKTVRSEERFIQGTITSSLYESLKQQNASDLLALKLSEVFAWQIDFYRIQRGDSYTVLFEENFIDTQFVGVGKILAAKFNHFKEDFYGVYFNKNGKDEYFDREGNSLQKVFLKAPLKFSRISSGYSRSRFHPILRKYRPHLGIDYAAPMGTPIVAVGDGIVTFKGRKGGAGRYVKVRHNATYTSGYMHLSKYGKGIRSGTKVNQGQVIGYVGSSGLSTGPHLDFRFWKNNSLVNFRKIKFPSTHPVADSVKPEFTLLSDSLFMKLENIATTSDSIKIAAQNK